MSIWNQVDFKRWVSEQAGASAATTYRDYLKIKGFEDVGYFLKPYVVSGGNVAADVVRNDTIHAVDVVVSLNDDIMYRDGSSFRTLYPNSIYFLDFIKEGDWHWGTDHADGAAGVDYLPIASVTTDSFAMISAINDMRGYVGGFRLKDEYGLEDYATKAEVNAGLELKANQSDLVATYAQLADIAQSRNGLNANAIINGNFDVWQRGTSFTAVNVFTADRWYKAGGTVTRQTFASGQGVVPNEPTYFMRLESNPSVSNSIVQKIEDVRTFAGQTVTLSFWAKAAAAFTLDIIRLRQNFGSGGSVEVNTSIQSVEIITGWKKYELTFYLQSISGKIIGQNSYLGVEIRKDNASFVLDIAQVQLHVGEAALLYQPRSFAEELALCQRYYEKSYAIGTRPETATANGSLSFQTRIAINASTIGNLYPGQLAFKVRKRTTPTVVIYSSDTGAPSAVRNANNSTDRTGVSADLVSDSAIGRLAVDATSANAISLDHVLRFHWVADAEL